VLVVFVVCCDVVKHVLELVVEASSKKKLTLLKDPSKTVTEELWGW
jgi:hypothetical protein